MKASEIRTRRVASRITGLVLSSSAQISNSRLSLIERGQATPSAEEMGRISAALTRLETARVRIDQVAAEAGWPIAGAVA